MRQKCKYDKNRDLKQTAPNLSIDLSQALKDKVIPSSGTQIEHNELESSSAIGMRVRDNFEAIEAQRMITAQGKAIAAAEKAAKAAAEKAAKAAAEQTSTQPPAEGAN